MTKYRINQIKLNIDEEIETLPDKIKKKIGIVPSSWEITRESVDARDKSAIYKVYTVDFDVEDGCSARIGRIKGIEKAPDLKYVPAVLKRTSEKRPVVVGFGPAGMFAALILAQAGLKPVVIERGQDVDTRTGQVEEFWNKGILDINSNVQFGEGGAGTFSDGKLTTGTKDYRIKKVLNEMVAHGGPEDILYRAKPHIGTDVLKTVVRNIREDIKALGGEVRFGELVTKLDISDVSVTGVRVRRLNPGFSGERTTEYTIETDAVLMCIGHSSRDTFEMLNKMGIGMTQKPFSMGVRIEHPQDLIDTAQYGKPAGQLGLPVSDYKLNVRTVDGRGVYTFCMCPGGKVIPASSEEGMLAVNGMSYHDRNSGIANSAVLVDIRTEDFGSDDIMAGVRLQQKYERLAYENGLAQSRMKLGEERKYYAPNAKWKDIRNEAADAEYVENSLPEFVFTSIKEAIPQFGRKLRGFDDDEAKLTAIESRSSSPVRITRGENMEGTMNFGAKVLHGFYPVGEGAGYAGGIMSAAVDGIKAAEMVISGGKNEIR